MAARNQSRPRQSVAPSRVHQSPYPHSLLTRFTTSGHNLRTGGLFGVWTTLNQADRSISRNDSPQRDPVRVGRERILTITPHSRLSRGRALRFVGVLALGATDGSSGVPAYTYSLPYSYEAMGVIRMPDRDRI